MFTFHLNLLFGRWNLVSLLVLLCQGLLFENENGNSGIMYAFGVLIVIILCGCLVLTLSSSITSLIFPHKDKKVLISRRKSQKLPRPTLLELYFVNTLFQIDDKRELEIDLELWRSVLSRSEAENLLKVLKQIYSGRTEVGPQDDEKHEATTSNLLEVALSKKPGDQITDEMHKAQSQFLSEFIHYNYQQGAAL
jgi:hypothetical protein